MKVSFTGTRKGMTETQKRLFRACLDRKEITEFCHGDCIGADEGAHNIAVSLKTIEIKKRPCNLNSQRAFTKEGTCLAEPEHPLDRNKKIVDDGDMLIACPGEQFEERRSGTWATVRYARKQGKRIIIIWPNGNVKVEN